MKRSRLTVACGLVAVAALARGAAAHPLSPALLQIEEQAGGLVEVAWRTAAVQFSDVVLRPRIPAGCRREGEPVQSAGATDLVERWTMRCSKQGLTGSEIAVDGLPASRTDVLVRIQLADGRRVQGVLRPDAPSMVVPVRPARFDVLRDYGRLGIEHILGGPDHLLFVFGLLLLVSTTAALVRTITAFTAGHSITLSLAALGYTAIPSGPIEVLIALSVFVLAVDLARPADAPPTLLGKRPWAMAALFGLLHGLGFAGALRAAGLPEHEIPSALLAFNVGIEIGQLAFVLAILALRRLVRPLLAPAPGWLAPLPVYGMGALAALWVIERSLALL